MFKKQLTPLAVILVVLAAVLVIQHWRQAQPSLEQELELEGLAPPGFLVSDVVQVELYRGGKENQKILLTRKDDRWHVESRFNSPGKREAIEALLDKMKSLEGEFRSDEASVLQDYALEDDEALHFAVRRNGEDKAGYHLLVGKKENYERSFVRRSGENAVYTINVNLASEIGIYGAEDKAPVPSRWLDKTALDLDKEKIVKVALKTPDRSCVFEKQEEKKDEKEEAEAVKTDTETKKKMKWILVEGGLDGTFKQAGVDAILRSLDSFSAMDVEDPGDKSKLGLDDPGYRCEVTLENGERAVLVGAREQQGHSAYVMIEDRETIYKFADPAFKSLFKDGKDLFELKKLAEGEGNVTRITLRYPSAKIQLVRDEKEWTIASPQTGLEFKALSGSDIAKALASWSATDYADGMNLKALGLARPGMTASFAVEGGAKHTIVLGAQAKGTKGRYALLDDDKRVWVASSDDVEKMFPGLDSLFELEVADMNANDITSVQVETQDSRFVLARKGGDEWLLTAGKKKIKADKSKVDEFLERFSPVTASDLALGQGSLMKDVYAKVCVETKGRKRLDIQFGGETDDNRAARVNGKSAILLFSKDTANGLVPPLKDLEKKVKEAKPEEGKPEEELH